MLKHPDFGYNQTCQTLYLNIHVHLCDGSLIVDTDCVICEVRIEDEETNDDLNISLL
jgi:hypothetical protein